jgi:hypothetical protein
MAEGKPARKAVIGRPFTADDPRINRTKPGPGRPADKAKAEWAALAAQGRKALRDKKVMDDPTHPVFPFALKHSSQMGEGLPAQTIQGPDGGPVQVQVLNSPAFRLP